MFQSNWTNQKLEIDIFNENEKQSARQETQGRIPIVGRRKWFEKKFKKKKRKEVLLFFVLFVYPANVFNRFQQFFHWLGKTAIIAIDMTIRNQNFFGGCVAVLFVLLSSHARKKKISFL